MKFPEVFFMFGIYHLFLGSLKFITKSSPLGALDLIIIGAMNLLIGLFFTFVFRNKELNEEKGE